jgi:hypothetical protein
MPPLAPTPAINIVAPMCDPTSAQHALLPVIPASCCLMGKLLCDINHPELTLRWIEEEMDDSLLADMELEVKFMNSSHFLQINLY